MTQRRVMIEMQVPHQASEQRLQELIDRLARYGFDRDPDYLVPISSPQEKDRRYRNVLLRGRIEAGKEEAIESLSDVVRVWIDGPIVPLATSEENEKAQKNHFLFGF